MGEGIAKMLFKDKCEVFSAGTHPSFVHPKAIKSCAQINIDISNNRSKSVNEFKDKSIDLVVTVCDNAKESCPVFNGEATKLHLPFEDPVYFEGEAQDIKFKEVRDLIVDTFKLKIPPFIEAHSKKILN